MKNDLGPLPLGDILNQATARSGKSPLSQLLAQVEAATKPVKPLTRVQNRLLEPCPEHDREICFQHSVLCQTGLPYRDPGDDGAAMEARAGKRSPLKSKPAASPTPRVASTSISACPGEPSRA